MSGGGDGGGTTRTEPPKYQLPFLEYGVQQARSLYNTGPRVAPINNDMRDAFNQVRLTASHNNIGAPATQLASQTLAGDFLGSNPYLDQTFEKARLASQSGLASEFARAGRNAGGADVYGLRGQQLNDLSNQIYGGAYDAERNRQQQVLGMSPQLDAAQYTGINQLLGVGSALQQQSQRELDAPGDALDQYLGRVSGNMGSTVKVSQPSGFSGSGALGGAMLGSMFGPIGTIGGGILGGWF